MSQGLAQSEDRGIVESMLWGKVAETCRQAKVPLDDHAPDFVVAAMIPPPAIGVYRINDDVQVPEPPDASRVFDQYFHPGDDDDGGSPEPPKAPKKKREPKKAVAKDGEA